MRIWQFVITGGPCAGKTTALSVLEQKLTQKGYKVIIVAETATELITSGISPVELENEAFQSILISRGVNKETTARKAAELLNRDTVIFYDRGLLDNKAYMPQEMFEKVLKTYGLTEVEARDEYDAVFHLVTAADGAEHAYTLENNKARKDTLDEARALDKATRDAWIGHQHMAVIDNSTDFQDKIDRLLKAVYYIIGLPIPIENKRRFLVKLPTDEELSKAGKITKTSIMQMYLDSDDPTLERRVRQLGDGQSFTYYYTEKRDISGTSRAKSGRKISQKEYVSFLMNGKKRVRKDRYCFVYNNQYFKLDIYPDWTREAILQIEATSENQNVELPDWVNLIREVTDDPVYKNKNLAK